jgi:predicted P-loop ATPase
MPILEAEQGAGKSNAINILFSPWFTDDLAELGTKDAAMQLRTAWGIEVAELSAMTRGEIERVKAFISRRVDRFRPAYGRHVIEAPRQSVFIGTTNAGEYLKDDTGNRRFLPIRCGKIDDAAIKRDRDQLWAEAVQMHRDYTRWWVAADDEEAFAQQEERREVDTWQEPIEDFLATREEASAEEILKHLGVEVQHQARAHEMRVGHCVKVAGWQRVQVREGARRRRVYRRNGA